MSRLRRVSRVKEASDFGDERARSRLRRARRLLAPISDHHTSAGPSFRRVSAKPLSRAPPPAVRGREEATGGQRVAFKDQKKRGKKRRSSDKEWIFIFRGLL